MNKGGRKEAGLNITAKSPIKLSVSAKLKPSKSKIDWTTVILSVSGSLLVAVTSCIVQERTNRSNSDIEDRKIAFTAKAQFGQDFPKRDQSIVACIERIESASWELGAYLDKKLPKATEPKIFQGLLDKFKAEISVCRIELFSALLAFRVAGYSDQRFTEAITTVTGKIDALRETVLRPAQQRLVSSEKKPVYVLPELESALALLKDDVSRTLPLLREVVIELTATNDGRR